MTADSYPLAPIQEGMLFHWLLDRTSGTDVEQIVADLREPIERARFEAAWQRTLDAFDVLRTSFSWNETDRPMQRIEQDVKLHVAFDELQQRTSSEAERKVDEFILNDRHRLIDLGNAPAMRVTVFCLGPAHFRMVWTFHHILIDGRSFELILNYLFATYRGENPGKPQSPSYKAYIDWTVSTDRSVAAKFWTDKLGGFNAPTALPRSIYPTKSKATSNVVDERISAEASSMLRALATKEGVSLNTVIMAAWALLLARHSGNNDVLFGATKTTRRGTIAGAESMVGLFLATIPVRVTVDENATLGDWLRLIRAEWIALRGHEHLPLVAIKQLTGVPAAAHLFDSLVVFENYKFSTRLRDQGGEWNNRDFELLEQTGFPLTLLAYADNDLLLRLEFDRNIYARDSARRLLLQVTKILASWADNNNQCVGDTDLLAEDERRRVLTEWNDTVQDFPRNVPLAALIEEQVRESPDSVAVVFGGQSMTYRELNEKANNLAHELVNAGARRNTIVGICLERSPDMVVALLAVAKSGAAYVPMDPGFPSNRLGDMVTAAQIRILISEPEVVATLASFEGRTISVRDLQTSAMGSHNLQVACAPTDLAYIIFTSGTTGKPKGVEISRGAFTNFVWSMKANLQLRQADSIVALTTISFDIAGLELFLPLVCGMRIILAPRNVAIDARELRTLIESAAPTVVQATPATWRMLFDVGWNGSRSLTALCGGEAMPLSLLGLLTQACKSVWNMYGPTETTVWSTMYQASSQDEVALIGRPIANTTVYILDERGQPVPIGATGELYIGGAGVSDGYHRQPELTAQRFLPDPFRTGQRIYRTGDLARFHLDGNTECLGRTDHQVKIRGFRIELGEIEHWLKLHPAVKDAVVIARDDNSTDKRLVAYLVRAAGHDGPFDPTEIRTYLKDLVPDYMVPTVFVTLAEIPLSANGKIDRKALPAPDSSHIATAATNTPPRTYVEKQLSEIWEEVFSAPEIGVTDDFFDLGGHSLLALQIMAKISQVFGKQLPLNTLFESPTIERLAMHIQGDEKRVGQHTLVSIQATGSRPPIFWIPGGAALGLFRLRHIVTRLGPDQPVYGLGSSAPKSLDDVEDVEQRAANYLKLIREVQPHGPYCIAGFCAGGRVAFEIAQRLTHDGETVQFLGLINCGLPNYPTGRLKALRLKTQRLRHQIRTARAEGLSFANYAKRKVEERRRAGNEAALRRAARTTVAQVGLDPNAKSDNELLLDATIEQFERYQPVKYPGHVCLFISDDEAGAGVSQDLDARFAWRNVAESHEVREFPGGHDAVLEMPHAIGFAETLRAALDAAYTRADAEASKGRQ